MYILFILGLYLHIGQAVRGKLIFPLESANLQAYRVKIAA